MGIERQKLVRIALPAGIIALGLVLMITLIKLRPEPKKSKPDTQGSLVTVETLSQADWDVTVKGTGSVRARQEVTVIPQVTGTVESIAAGFAEGGFFKKDQVLLRIDPTDYKLALRQAQAAEARAEYELEQIKSRADIARSEWDLVSRTTAPEGAAAAPPNPLVLYEPQLKNAKASLQSASAMVEQARLNLERTTLRAPFDCRVRSKNVDVGQFVRSGSAVAVLASTGAAEVVVPLEREELRWIDIPRPGGKSLGSRAYVSLPGTGSQSGEPFRWEGRVVRSGGEVDVKSRMVQAIVSVEDPYGLRKGNGGRPQLLSGSFVNVEIAGSRLKGVFDIPRAALRDNDTIWIMDNEGLLRIRGVEVLRIEEDRAILGKGPEAGDELVLTRLSGAADGMRLRTSGLSNVASDDAAVANAPAVDTGGPDMPAAVPIDNSTGATVR